jgi:mitochondrial fission protein ELM1
VLVILAVGAIFAIPYLNPKTPEFAVTPDPVNKLAQAAAAGKPVFLEFYGSY